MYWDQITPENEGKWGSVEGTRDQMNWARPRRHARLRQAEQHPVQAAHLRLGQPAAGLDRGLSQAEQNAEVEEWIRLFCERYPDTQLIDVVNEPPPHTTPSYANALGGAARAATTGSRRRSSGRTSIARTRS